MNFASAITTALASVPADFVTNVTAVLPTLLLIAGGALVIRRVLRFIR